MTSTTVKTPTVRAVSAIVTLFIPLGVVLGSSFLWSDGLPPELASHFAGTGRVDGTMSVGQLLTVALVMTGGAAFAGVIVGVWPGIRSEARRIGMLTSGILAGAGAGIWLISATLSLRASDLGDVVMGPWYVLSFAAAGYGVVPFLLSPKPQRTARDIEERIDLGPGEGGAWSGAITARLFLWCSIVLIAVGITVGVTSVTNGASFESLGGLIVIAVISALVASFSRLHVTADWRGLRVVSSALRLPLKRIRLEDIETVGTGELVPSDWGGWGYRGTPGRSSLILRKGPGLIITTTSQRQFALTLDHPELPAALLATLRDNDRAATSSGPGSTA